jgi:hypothetical protein
MNIFIEPEIKDYSPVIYKDIINVLKLIKANYRLMRVRKKIKKKRIQYVKYPVLHEGDISWADLLIVFSPYATSHNVKSWSQKYKKQILHLEFGFLPNSVLCDIGGFWGEAYANDYINEELEKLNNSKFHEWSKKYSDYLIENNISKRKQPLIHSRIDKEFVFLPMQYMNDQSVLRFGNMPYPSFVKHVAKFCSDNNLVLAIKKHPHAYNKEPRKVDKLLKTLKKRFGKTIAVVDGSVHWFCKNCKFMAGMNTGAVSDGLINGTIISHCGKSIFEKTFAVIHDNNIIAGLEKCLSLNEEEIKFMKNRQLSLLYFLYNRYLLLEEDSFGSELSNEEKILIQLNHEKTYR